MQKHSAEVIPATDMPEDLLTVSEVAKHLRVDDTTVRRWINLGALAAVTLPHANKRRAYRIKRATLDSVLIPVNVARG